MRIGKGAERFLRWMVLGLLWPIAAEAADQIGALTVSENDVTASLEDAPIPATIDSPVFFLQLLSTGEDSAAQSALIDETRVTLGENARLKFDDFVFDPAAGKQKALLSMDAGTLRWASGKMDKSAYELRTPSAAIGVRGTIFVAMVADDGATGVYVEEGSVILSGNQGGSVELEAGQYAVVPASGATPSAPSQPPTEVQVSLARFNTALLTAAPASMVSPATVVNAQINASQLEGAAPTINGPSRQGSIGDAGTIYQTPHYEPKPRLDPHEKDNKGGGGGHDY